MRYYKLILTNSAGQSNVFTSYPNGLSALPDPGALNIEFDIPVGPQGVPTADGGASVTLEGVALKTLFQSQQYAGYTMTLQAGMGPGLPLAKPAQIGTILTGTVFQSFGNWTGTEMTLDFVVVGSPYTVDAPGNFSVNWPAGTPLGIGVQSTLLQAFPNAKVNVAVNASCVLNYAKTGVYPTLRSFATFVQGLTSGLVSSSYPGISIVYQNGQFSVFDTTVAAKNVALAFEDFVGQPTWILPNTVQVALVMRGDINIADTVTFPVGLQSQPGIASTQSTSLSGTQKYQSSFQGTFIVTTIRAIGNLRSTSGLDWIAILNCVQNGG